MWPLLPGRQPYRAHHTSTWKGDGMGSCLVTPEIVAATVPPRGNQLRTSNPAGAARAGGKHMAGFLTPEPLSQPPLMPSLQSSVG